MINLAPTPVMPDIKQQERLSISSDTWIRSHVYVIASRRKSCTWDFYLTTITYTPSILHLTLIHCNSLIINILLSVRCCQFYLHATYTPHMLPHGTSAGDRYHSIGEQESLLLRQIVLRPSGVQPAAYVQTDCKIYAGACKIFWNHLTHLKPLYINLLRAKSVRWQWKHTHSFTSGLTGRAQLFVYKLYTFFVGSNALVLPLQHFNSTLILY